MSRFVLRLMGFLVFIFATNSFAAEIPKSLEEWTAWVLEKHPDLNCPFLFNEDQRACVWPQN